MLHWADQNLELSSQHTALLAAAHHWMGNRLSEGGTHLRSLTHGMNLHLLVEQRYRT